MGRCPKCQGLLIRDTGIDLVDGMMIEEAACVNCGGRWFVPGEPVRLMRSITPKRRDRLERELGGPLRIL